MFSKQFVHAHSEHFVLKSTPEVLMNKLIILT